MADTPIYEPGLISDNSVFATPHTATLSVMRTFISSPSRDLMVRSEPSTASMVPRMRTGGGCWAHATDPSTVMAIIEAIRRVSKEDIFMGSPYPEFRDNSKTPQRGGYSTASVRRRGRVIPALHRRRQPVAANADAVG